MNEVLFSYEGKYSCGLCGKPRTVRLRVEEFCIIIYYNIITLYNNIWDKESLYWTFWLNKNKKYITNYRIIPLKILWFTWGLILSSFWHQKMKENNKKKMIIHFLFYNNNHCYLAVCKLAILHVGEIDK